MSEEKKNVGPAFPTRSVENFEGKWRECYKDGLTKREWFAGMASDETVKLAAQEFMAVNGNRTTCSQAEARYWYADEMIRQGEK